MSDAIVFGLLVVAASAIGAGLAAGIWFAGEWAKDALARRLGVDRDEIERGSQ